MNDEKAANFIERVTDLYETGDLCVVTAIVDGEIVGLWTVKGNAHKLSSGMKWYLSEAFRQVIDGIDERVEEIRNKKK